MTQAQHFSPEQETSNGETTLVQNAPPYAGALVLSRAAQLYPLGLRGEPGMDLQPLILGPPGALFSPTHPSGVWTADRTHWSFPARAFGNSVPNVEVELSA